MTAFLEIYLSSFWAWSGITMGATFVLTAFAGVVASFRSGK